MTEVYNPKTVFPHAASLHQSFLHCAISPTAASRRSLGRISVPMWPFNLSVRLLIIGLVCHYHTNYLISREPIYRRSFLLWSIPDAQYRHYMVLPSVSRCYSLSIARLLTCYSPVRHYVEISKLITTPFDLHVLGAPPAFVLSQDQTLYYILPI